MSRRSTSVWVVASVAAMLLLGCRGETVPLAKVRGAVTLDGKPLTQGSVQLTPDAGKGTHGPLALGKIEPDGKFVLTTFRPGDGAQVGFHRVAVNCWDITPGDPNRPDSPLQSKSLIPEHYADEQASGLAVEVKRGITNELTLDLKSAATVQ